MHQGRLLSSLHLTATSINQLRERVELAGTDDASNNRLSSYTYRYAPASVSPQGFTTSTIPLTATGPTPEPAIAVASSEPSAASSLLITVDLFKNEGADGIEEKQQRSQDPETDETNPTPSGLPLVIDSHVKKEVLLQCFRQMRDWFKLLSYLTRPWKRWTKGQRQFLSHINDDDHGQLSKNIPRYVLDYAPLVHLSSNEQFWPCDIAEHLLHVDPRLNYTLLRTGLELLNLTNLDQLNKWDYGGHLYIQSKDDVETRPQWLSGRKNIPSDSELPRIHGSNEDGAAYIGLRDQAILGRKTYLGPNEHTHGDTVHTSTAKAELNPAEMTLGGRSRAPATLIVVQKADGIVDAFWFFFYSYNLGNQVLVRFGNHVGDWEHTMVRFENGKPKAVYYSEHFFGRAYTYEAVEKIGNRPVSYSAIGTHAMYASPGIHRYILPLGLLHDITDRGPLWDPSLNVRMYAYDHDSNQLSPGNFTPDVPIEWFYYNGHWGDKSYRLSDPRQYMFAGQYHYVDGPLGPRFKNLGREGICEHPQQRCVVRDRLDEDQIRRWHGTGEGEDLESDDDAL